MSKTLRDIIHRKSDVPSGQNSEPKYRLMVEESCDGIGVLVNGKLRFASSRLAEMMGCSVSDVWGREFADYLVPQSAQFEREGHAMVMRGESVGRIQEMDIARNDGDVLSVELNSSAVYYDKEFAELIVVRDITNRKQELDELELVSEGYRAIFENSAVAITVTNEEENIISWNKFTEELLGIGGDELYLKPVSSLYPEDEWMKIRAENVRQMGMKHHLETKMITGGGRLIDVDISLNVLRGLDGQITGSIGVITDISERKLAYEVLESRERYFRSVIDQASDGVLVLNGDMSVRFVSGAAREMRGEARGDDSVAVGFELIHSEDEQLAADALLDIVNSPRKSMDLELRVRREDGSWCWVEVVGKNLIDDPDVHGIVLNVRDINERKLAEEAAREREFKYSALLELSPDGVVVIRNRRVVFANNRTHELLGCGEAELLGNELVAILSSNLGDILDGMPVTERRAVMERLPEPEWDFHDTRMYEIPIRMVGSDLIWLEIHANSIEYNGETLQLAFLRDISARKRAERLGRRSINDMAERFNELNFLYRVSEVVKGKGGHLDEVLQGIVDLIQISWQDPSITYARIWYDGREFKTADFMETMQKQFASIVVRDEVVGCIEVYLGQDPVVNAISPDSVLLNNMTRFMEKSLIDALAMYLGVFIECKLLRDGVLGGERESSQEDSQDFVFIEVIPKRNEAWPGVVERVSNDV